MTKPKQAPISVDDVEAIDVNDVVPMSEVPGSRANRSARNLQRLGATQSRTGEIVPARLKSLEDPLDPRRPIGDKLAAIGSGVWQGTVGGAIDAVKQDVDKFRANPLEELAIRGSGLGYLRTLNDAVYQPARNEAKTAARLVTTPDQTRPTETVPQRLSRAGGHALAAVVPLVGPASASIGEQTATGDPYHAGGEAAGLVGSFFAPAAARLGMKYTGPIGRAFQRSAVRTFVDEMGVTRQAERAPLLRTNETGQPTGIVPNVLDAGNVPSLSKRRLLDSIERTANDAGERVRAAEADLPRGEVRVDGRDVVRSLDDEIRKRQNIDPDTGRPQYDPETGRPIGRTLDDDAAIRNLERRRAEIERSVDANGEIDIHDLIDRRRGWDDSVYEHRKATSNSLEPSSPAASKKLATDVTRRAVNEATPDIAVDREAFHSGSEVAKILAKRLEDLPVIERVLKVPKSLLRGALYTAAATATGPFGMFAQVAAGVDALRLAVTSTAWRSVSAATKWRIGKFLEAGEIDRAASLASTSTNTTQPARLTPGSEPNPQSSLPPATSQRLLPSPTGLVPSREPITPTQPAYGPATASAFPQPATEPVPATRLLPTSAGSTPPFTVTPEGTAITPGAQPARLSVQELVDRAARAQAVAAPASSQSGIARLVRPSTVPPPAPSTPLDLAQIRQLVDEAARSQQRATGGKSSRTPVDAARLARSAPAPTTQQQQAPKQAPKPIPSRRASDKPATGSSTSPPTPTTPQASTLPPARRLTPAIDQTMLADTEYARLTSEAKRAATAGKWSQVDTLNAQATARAEQLAAERAAAGDSPAAVTSARDSAARPIERRRVEWKSATGKRERGEVTHSFTSRSGDPAFIITDSQGKSRFVLESQIDAPSEKPAARSRTKPARSGKRLPPTRN